jgi:hypothetical protein
MSPRIAVYILAIGLIAPSLVLAQSVGPRPQTEQEYGRDADVGSGSSQMTPSEEQAKARLESAGYTNVRNVHAGSEVMSAKAMKDGKEVDIIIDSFGKIIARPAW